MAGNIKGITIEIGGDTTTLDKALKGVNATSKDLNGQLRQVNNSLKFNPGNSDLLAQKQRLLAESIKNTKSKLDTLKEAQKQAEIQFKNGKIGVEEYEALQREVLKTTNQLENLEKQQKDVNKNWKEVANNVADIGNKTKDVGQSMMKNVTAPIVALGAGSMKAFSEVDEGLDTIITKTGATGKQAEQLNKSFENVYGQFPASSQQVGDVIGELNTQFGFMGKELEDKSLLMLKFAEINKQDVTQSTIQSKQAIEAFNLTGKDLNMVLDSATKVSQQTGVGVDKLFDSVVKGAPALKGLGLNFAESTALMGRFEQSGVDSSKAISYLTKAQSKWAKEGKSMQQGLKELETGIKGAKNEQEAIALASEAFGTKAGPMMAKAIKEGKLNFDELKGSAEGAKGAVNSTFEATKDPIDEFKTTMNNLKLVGAELGTEIQKALAPVLKEIIKSLKGFLEWFKKLSPHTKQIIVKAALIAAALGPIIFAIGHLVAGVAGFAASIITIAPALASIGGAIMTALPIIGALVAAFLVGALIKKHWTEISNFFKFIFNGILNVIKVVAGVIRDTIVTIFTGIKDFFVGLWNAIKAITEAIWNAIKAYFEFTFNFYKELFTLIFNVLKTIVIMAWNGIKIVTETIWNGIKSFLLLMFDIFKNAFTILFDMLKTVVTTAWNGIKIVTETVWNGIKSFLLLMFNIFKNSFTILFNMLKTVVTTVWNGIKIVTETIWNGIKFVLTNVLNIIKNTFITVFNTIKSIVTNIWNGIKTVTSNIWNGIKNTLSNSLNAIKSTFSNIFNSLKGIVTNAFNAVKNAVSNGLNGAYNIVTGFVRKFFQAGRNIVNSIADGIKDAAENVKDAIGDIAQEIRNHLPFSPAKKGPLRDLNKLNFGGTISEGIYNGKSRVQDALKSTLKIPNLVTPEGIALSEYDFDDPNNPRNPRNSRKLKTGAWGININIEKLEVRNDDDIKRVAEELKKQIDREKRGSGI